MKDHNFLLEAIEQIDDDLIKEAAMPCRKRSWVPTFLCAAVACLVLVVGCSLFMSRPDPVSNTKSGTLYYAENLWQRADFKAYSLSYRTSEPSLLSSHSPSAGSTNAVSSKNLSISADQTIKFETLIAQRYAVYYSDTGYPIFYDTQEDVQVDLQERILGDTNRIFMEYMEAAERKANEMYPGMLRSETNRRLFWEYLYAISRELPLQDIVAQTPDTDFMNDLYGWDDREIEAKNTEFWTMCWAAFVGAETDLDGQLYSINILGIDAKGGQCILRANDIYGNGWAYLIYDIKTDTYKDLPNCDRVSMNDGYLFRFSSDSSIATIASPDANFSGANLYLDLTNRFVVPSKERYVQNYMGENLGVFFLNEGKAQMLYGSHGSSELFVSENNGVLYYKQIEPSQTGKSFHASDAVWFNRLTLYNKDTDHWVFHTVSDDSQVSSKGITLQGNFIRFAAQETVVIMERGGSYFAYSLKDGSDITEEITAGKITMFAHEQMIVYLENGKLYRKNLFQDTAPEVICDADNFVVSDDGAFVFAYHLSNRFVTCYNVATLESCTITMEQQMCDQLFETDSAMLQMNYNPEENTLLLSFYVEAEQNTENTSDVDFYDLLMQLNDKDPSNHFPENPTIITDYTVSEEIMDAFRDSMHRYLNPNGVISWETYYPEFLSIYEDLDSICKKLGLDFSEIMLDVNGTQFVLYQDEDEKLTLTFYQFWGLFDYDDFSAGFEIRYNDTEVQFTFLTPSSEETDPEEPPKINLPFEILPAAN